MSKRKKQIIPTKHRSHYNLQPDLDTNPFETSSGAFSQPLIPTSSSHSVTDSLQQSPKLPILMDNIESQSLRCNLQNKEDISMDEEESYTLPPPRTDKSRSNRSGRYFDVDNSLSINNQDSLYQSALSPLKNQRGKSRKKKQKNKFNFSFAPTLRAPWNENVKDLLLRKLRNQRGTPHPHSSFLLFD